MSGTTRKLKVYGWLGDYPRDMERPADTRHRVQAHCVVAAPSKAAAARAAGYEKGEWGYAAFVRDTGETWNEHSNAAALSKPGTVFFQDDLNHTPGEGVYLEHLEFPKSS